MTQGDEAPLSERRASSGERRRYNRRSAPEPGSPPYYEVFDRIATALEVIAASVSGPTPAPPTAVRPRRSSDADSPHAS